MSCCKVTSFVLRGIFLAFFILNAYTHFENIDGRAKALTESYANFEKGVKHVSGKDLPKAINSKALTKNSQIVAQYLTYAQLGLGVLALFVPCFVPLVGFLHLLCEFISLNGMKFFLQKHALAEYEPILIALALFAGSLFICCAGKSSGNCKTNSADKEKQKNDKKKH